MKTSWFFFRKFLFSKNAGSVTKAIAWLSLLGIGVSTMAMVVVTSVMGGFGNAIEDRLINFEPHLIIKSKTEDSRLVKNELTDLSEDLNKKFKLNAFLFDQEQVVLRTPAGNYSGAVAKGLEEKSLQHFLEASRQFGQNKVKKFSWDQEIESKMVVSNDDVMVGSELAYQTGIFMGDQVVLTPPESLILPPGEVPQFVKMNVQDIIRTNVQNIDSQVLIYKKREKGKLFRDSVSLESLLEVYLDNSKDLEAVVAGIDSKKYDVETWKQRNSSLFYSLKMEKLLISFFLFLAVLIGCFTIVTVLVLLATQKRKDIGILLTLGMKKKELVRVFTQIGFLLSSAGVLLGFFVGLCICLILAKFQFINLPDVYYDRTIPVQFNIREYMWILGITFTISYLSARYPARLITSFQPQDILRKN
jgi:lipoprotein-releasing system permease protein